jgi:predicted chitinase
MGFAGNTIRALYGLKDPTKTDDDSTYSETLSSSTKILGSIFEQMQKVRAQELENRSNEEKNKSDKNKQDDKFNEELIKALSVRRKPKKKRPTEKKEEPTKKAEEKKEETKPPEKKKEEPTKKVEEKKEETKPPEKKKEEPTKKVEEKKVEEPKPKVEEKKVETKPPPEKKIEETKPKVEPEKPKVEAPKVEPAPVAPTKPKVEAPKVEPAPAAPTKLPPKELPKPTADKVTTTTSKPAPIGGAASKLPGVAGLIISTLISSGITSPKAQANILAQVKEESQFVPKSEDLFYRNAAAIQGTFGKSRIPTLEFAQQFVSKDGDNRSEQLANHVYAKTSGNSTPGDGFKYRGRGFIQITGKDAYKSLGDYLKVDLLSNPDLLNSTEIAAKSIPWFFLIYKKGISKGDPKNLEDISLVSKSVGFADPSGEKKIKRAKLALEIESYDSPPPAVPAKIPEIDQLSKENKQLKEESTPQNQTIVNNRTVPPTTNETVVVNGNKPNDQGALQRKTQ